MIIFEPEVPEPVIDPTDTWVQPSDADLDAFDRAVAALERLRKRAPYKAGTAGDDKAVRQARALLLGQT